MSQIAYQKARLTMAELKPCPFCGQKLEKQHINYDAYRGGKVEYDIWVHPSNDCILYDCNSLEEEFAIFEKQIPSWNRRADNA